MKSDALGFYIFIEKIIDAHHNNFRQKKAVKINKNKFWLRAGGEVKYS